MDKIVSAIGKVPQTKTRNDDDISDRILYRYTVNIMILLAIIVSTKQYVGEPIQCWVPAEFTGSHEEYTNNFCWIRNTYYLAYDKNIPKEHEPEKRHVIPYYQWMPIFLSLQAFFYYLPTLLWRATNNRSGVNVHTIVEAAESFSDSVERRTSTLKCMTLAMNRFVCIGAFVLSKHSFVKSYQKFFFSFTETLKILPLFLNKNSLSFFSFFFTI